MSKVNGKTVTVVGDLTADDAKFGSKFDAAKPQVVVKYDDGRSEVVAKTDVKE